MNNQKLESRKSLYKIAYITNYVIMIISGIALIPLAWMIPLTRKTKEAMNAIGTPSDKTNPVLAVLSFFLSFELAAAVILIADIAYAPEEKIVI